ncbi:MAG: cobalt-precorrin-5B (C(1))-methyltransferase [bacterium]
MKEKKEGKLRTGYTTGTAATAAAVAGVYALYTKMVKSKVAVEAPAGRIEVPLKSVFYGEDVAEASVIKDGGDDPDCTHGIKIVATVFKQGVSMSEREVTDLNISYTANFRTGVGIGIVTKEGLPVKVGEPAVNPVPRKMLKENVEKLIKTLGIKENPTIILSVPEGREVAKHTLNERLGVVKGISILGSTGIVNPVSLDAFTATIELSLNIAKKKKLNEVVLCFGRTSEEGARALLGYPEEAYVMMGDFFRYALDRAVKKGFNVILAGQPAKIFKAALEVENTNVKYGVFSPQEISGLLKRLSIEEHYIKRLSKANTARHLYEIVEKEKITGLWERLVQYISERYKIKVLLFSYSGELLAKA